MNKKLLSTALSAVLLFFAGGQRADAASWRINNNANRHAHFADINAAMASNDVTDGDILYLDPGCLITSNQNVTKRVTIIGTGYFLGDNPVTSASINGTLTLKVAGIKVESLVFTTAVSIKVQANNIIVERCKTFGIDVENNAINTTIRQCYIAGGTVGRYTASQVTLENCIIVDNGDFALSSLRKSIIRNNTFCTYYDYSSQQYAYVRNLSDCVIKDNIFLNTKNNEGVFYSCSECTIKNNVLCCTGSAYVNDNKTGITTKADLFILSGEQDSQFQLKDGSPAKKYATDGGDCGAYGGRYPYVPSGYPFGMPHFESSVVGTRPQSGQVSVTQQVTIQKQ